MKKCTVEREKETQRETSNIDQDRIKYENSEKMDKEEEREEKLIRKNRC